MLKNKKLYRTKGRNHYLPKYDDDKVHYRWLRNKKPIVDCDGNEILQSKMTRKNKDGYDYTPLYQYLIKSVGRDFDLICKEVYPRIEDRSKIWDIIEKEKIYFKDGVAYYLLNNECVDVTVHNSFNHWYGTQDWSALYIDDNNILQFVDKNYRNFVNGKTCDWETVTLNGKKVK